jgi:hypothetical protein
VAVAVGVCASLTLLLGLYSTPIATGARAAAHAALAQPGLSPSHVAVAAERAARPGRSF